MNRRRWHVLPALAANELMERTDGYSSSPARLRGNSKENLSITPLLVQLLHNRGVTDPRDFHAFLTVDETLANDPFLLPDIEKSTARVLRAIRENELIAVYGDFDADGITGTALLAGGILRLGGSVVHYIPRRVEEGHGLNYPALEMLKSQGVSLVITVDCGITEVNEVIEGHKLGLDIVITDHHVPAAQLPSALGAIDPKREDSVYPFRELAGVGVAYKFMQALYSVAGKETEWDDFLELVALGTVSDMVPLRGENRYLVKRGLEALNRSRRPGLLELVHSAGLEMGKMEAESISYRLGPRLNASGRIDHSVTSYELLMASSREQACKLAATLEANNTERQRLTAEMLASAREKLLADGTDLPLIMVGGHNYPSGVVGVVAGKLVDDFYRPAIVLHLDGDVARGSARSIPEFNLVAALTECSDLLSRYGGHHQAAGFIMPMANVDTLNKRLMEIADRELAAVDLRPVLTIDAAIPLSEMDNATFRSISRLAPFGQANQVPTFLSCGVEVVEKRTVGESGDHLKLRLRDGRIIWDAIGFDLGKRQLASLLDIVYYMEVDQWGGRKTLRLHILDLVPSA